MQDKINRCDWAEHNPLLQEYHDNVWGKPVHDEQTLFKMLMLEAMQAGLNWLTILRKMDTLTAAFDDFDPALVREYDVKKIETLLLNDGIIKNRAKILSCIHNAKMYYALCEKHGSLNEFLWKYVDGNLFATGGRISLRFPQPPLYPIRSAENSNAWASNFSVLQRFTHSCSRSVW